MKNALLRTVAIGALLTAGAVALATPIASLALWVVLQMTHTARVDKLSFSETLYCWWTALIRHGTDPHFATKLAATAAVPLAVMAAVVLSAMARRGRRRIRPQRPGDTIAEPVRVASNIHGKARWMTIDEATRLYQSPKPGCGGIPIVELLTVAEDHRADCRLSGTRPLLIDPMVRGENANGVIIGRPGTGKTSGFTIGALHQYPGSMVINDPSGAASAVTAEYRLSLGHKVAIIDVKFPELGAFNILKTIDITDKMAPVYIKQFVTEASGQQKAGGDEKQEFFKAKGISLNTALLADLLYDPGAEHTVREWRRRIVTPEREMKGRLQSIYVHTRSDYARDIVGELMDTYHETASGIRSHATGDTEWLSLTPFATLLSEDTFDPTELIHGKQTVFMQFQSRLIKSDPSIARVILGSLMRSVMKADGRVATNVPFIVDETCQLKHMESLEIVRDEGRKYGMPLYSMWQSEYQIEKVWKSVKDWYDTAAWRMYLGGVDNPATAKELSSACGTYTVMVPNEGRSESHQTASTKSTIGDSEGFTLQPRKLVSEDELRTGFRKDEALLLMANQPPARFIVARYHARPDMVADLNENPFLEEYEPPEEQETENA